MYICMKKLLYICMYEKMYVCMKKFMYICMYVSLKNICMYVCKYNPKFIFVCIY